MGGCSSKEKEMTGAQRVFGKLFEAKQLRLESIIPVNHNSKIFRLSLDANTTLGLPIGQHIQLEATIDGTVVKRSYTPITENKNSNYVDVLIKEYPKSEQHPNGGLMSQHVHSLTPGALLNVWGPRGKIQYHGKGKFVLREDKETGDFTETKSTAHIAMLAGGTGLAPMLQVIRAVLGDKNDTTKVTLIFANRAERDILCREELDELAKDARFELIYCLSRPDDDNWSGEKGHIDAAMVTKHFPSPSSDVFVLICGSPNMVNETYLPALSDYESVFTY